MRLFWVALLSLGLFSGCDVISPPSPKLARHAVHISNRLPAFIQVQYSWAGLGPYSIVENYQLTPDKDNRSYHVEGTVAHTPYDSSKQRNVVPINATIPSEKVLDVLQAVNQPVWHITPRPEEVIDHKDDYPNRLMVVENDDHVQQFKLMSSSNTTGGAPWNLSTTRAEIFTTTQPTVSEAMSQLLLALHPRTESGKT